MSANIPIPNAKSARLFSLATHTAIAIAAALIMSNAPTPIIAF